jgi:hypothetical protein
MSNPEEREQESRLTDEDNFAEEAERERRERGELAENIKQNEPDEDED